MIFQSTHSATKVSNFGHFSLTLPANFVSFEGKKSESERKKSAFVRT
jgi:hypothetical protein